MSWSRRQFLALPAALTLAGCGYTSVYAPGNNGSAVQGRIGFANPRSRDEYLLLQHMERRLGRAAVVDYRLDYKARVDRESLDIRVSGAQARYQYIGTVDFSLVDATTGQTITSGAVSDFTSYSAAGTTVATYAAEQDALERLMVSLGDLVTARILVADLS